MARFYLDNVVRCIIRNNNANANDSHVDYHIYLEVGFGYELDINDESCHQSG